MSFTGAQNPYGTKAAPQKYLQHGCAGVGQPLALTWARGAQLVVLVIRVVEVLVMQEQALDIREAPQVAMGEGAWTVLWMMGVLVDLEGSKGYGDGK